MKFIINKAVFFLIFLAIFLCSSCTYTPWHRQQSELFLNKGISYIGMGQYNNALKDLLEAEKYYYGNPKVHYYLGMSYHGKGMKDKAIEEFKEAISLDKNYSEAHNYLGTLYSDRELWDQAIEEFEKALENPLYDTPSMALYNMAWAYYSKKDYKTALVKYQETLNIDPATILQPQIEKNVGLIYSDQDNISEAIRHLKKSVELDSSLFDAHFILGESYLKIKDKKNARKSFQEVVKLAPDSSFGRRARNYLRSL
ncbi:MAG: tetratricopeptide repeat protein [Deltaproteobacteria bacterium]|nr:tetratricopeptide repeat protein [Deltaproteobacteria bacterium]